MFNNNDNRIKINNELVINKKTTTITIVGNTELANNASSGNGTPENPYIIENYIIDANGSTNYGISIQNTDKHFIIRNCEVRNSLNPGIFLGNVSYGNITNCLVENINHQGVYLYKSNNITILNNTIRDNSLNGIRVYMNSENITISRNYIYQNDRDGIYLYQSSYSSISNNTIFSNENNGIYQISSNNNSIFNNSVKFNSQNGLYIDGCWNATVDNNYFNANGYNGIYLDGGHNHTIFNNTANLNNYMGIVVDSYTYNCNISSNFLYFNKKDITIAPNYIPNNIIENNVGIDRTIDYDTPIKITNNTDFDTYKSQGSGILGDPYIIEDKIIDIAFLFESGIYIENTTAYFRVINCTFVNGTYDNSHNIYFKNVTHGRVKNCSSFNGYQGIFFDNCSNNLIDNNTIENNGGYGIQLYGFSTNNIIYDNNVNYNDRSGITIGYLSTLNDIINNTCNNNLDNGIYGYFSNYNEYINNTGVDNWDHGLEFYNSSFNNITGNVFNDNHNNGIDLSSNSNNNTFILNDMRRNDDYGISLDNSSYNNISGNFIALNGIDAIYEVDGLGNIFNNNNYDDFYPQWSNPKINPSSSIVYSPGQTISINMTWSDDFKITNVFLEFNNSNITISSHSGNEYYEYITDLPVGNYSYKWFAVDDSNQFNVSDIFWVNITPATPNLRLFINGNEGNYTAPYNSIINITYSIDISRPVFVRNNSVLLTTNSTSFWNFTNVGEFQIRAANMQNENYSTAVVYYYLKIIDDTAPKISNIVNSPASPIEYSQGAIYQFNATIKDKSTIETVLLEINNGNYTVPFHDDDVYVRNAYDLHAGNYSYRWLANDTHGNLGYSEYYWLNITKATPSLHLFLNGTEGNYTAPANTFINISVSINPIRPILVQNESSTITTNLTSIWNYTGVGIFEINVLSLGNINFTSNSINYHLNITEITPPQVSNIKTNSSAPIEYLKGRYYQFNSTWTDISGIDTVILEIDFVKYTVNDHVGGEYYYTINELSAGNHLYRWLANDTLNNIGLSNFYWFNITRGTPSIKLFFNGTEGDYTASARSIINITVKTESPLSIIIMNDSNVLTDNYISLWNFTRSGIFQITVFSSGNQNYTPAIVVNNLNITDDSPPILLNVQTDPSSPIEYSPSNLYVFNAFWIDESSINSVIFEFNGENFSVSNHFGNQYYYILQKIPVGNYQYRWFANDSYDQWGVTNFYWYNISIGNPIIKLYLNGNSGNYTAGVNSIINITVLVESSGIVNIYNESNFLTNSFISFWNFTSIGDDFNITVHYLGNENYTSSSITYFLSISAIPIPQVSNILTYPNSPVVFEEDGLYEFNATWIDDVGIDTVIFEFDGVNYTVINKSGNQYSYILTNLSIGTYQYRWYANDTNNNWVSSDYYSFKITESPKPFPFFLIIILALIAIGTTTTILVIRHKNKGKVKPIKLKKKPKDNVCANHEKVIDGPRYHCPNCGAAYCINCANKLGSKKSRCLCCNAPLNFYKIKSIMNQEFKIFEEGKQAKDKHKGEKSQKSTVDYNYYQLKRDQMSKIVDDKSSAQKMEQKIISEEDNFYKLKMNEFKEKKLVNKEENSK